MDKCLGGEVFRHSDIQRRYGKLSKSVGQEIRVKKEEVIGCVVFVAGGNEEGNF